MRRLVLRYPLLLGTAMNRVAERLEAMQACHYSLEEAAPTSSGDPIGEQLLLQSSLT